MFSSMFLAARSVRAGKPVHSSCLSRLPSAASRPDGFHILDLTMAAVRISAQLITASSARIINVLVIAVLGSWEAASITPQPGA